MLKALLYSIRKIFFPFLLIFVIISVVNITALSVVYTPSINSILRSINSEKDYYFIIQIINGLNRIFWITTINLAVSLLVIFCYKKVDKLYTSNVLHMKRNNREEVDNTLLLNLINIQMRI